MNIITIFEIFKYSLISGCILCLGGILINFPEFLNLLKKPLNQELFEDGQLYKKLKIHKIIEPKASSNFDYEIGIVYLLKGEVDNMDYEKGVPISYYYKAIEYFEWVNNNLNKLRKEDKDRVMLKSQ